ncbi:uncharacterized protein LOC134459969 [Engraulis encrasicolus]|uniref:uncharacterized protein LOC134459969 n=1 Tax=Engraulis encrasicolus TaxID=184585 RepID=UPI002FD4E00D
MLLKVKYKGEQKFVKIDDVKLPELFDSAFRKFGIAIGRLNEAKLFDSTRTEIDEDVFEEVVTSNHQHVYELCLDGTPGDFDAEMSASRESSILEPEPDTIILNVESPVQFTATTDNTAQSLIEDILKNKPGGDQILREYRRTNKLTDSARRKLVNMVVANMTEIHGTSPSRSVRERHAKGIVQLFPQLKDPFSEKGYEHFYDSDSGTGFIAWRLKTLQKRAAEDQQPPAQNKRWRGGPSSERNVTEPELLSEEQLKEALSLMRHAADDEVVRLKMKQTFHHRQRMVHDHLMSPDVLSTFSRFADVKGLIEQDFCLLFGEETSAKLLERWPTMFKAKTIEQSKTLSHISPELQELIQAAESPQSRSSDSEDWDSDLSSLVLLLFLLPPTSQGRQKPGRLSATQAAERLVVFLKTGDSVQGHLDAITQTRQPYLLAVGMSRANIHRFFIVIDKIAIPCSATTSLGAFDELFKAHFVFGTEFSDWLGNMYTFIQTTIFNIDVGLVKENPRVIELRSRFLQ